MAQEFVIFLRQGFITDLGNAPGLAHIPAGLGTTQIVAHSWEGLFGQDVFRILAEVHGVKGDALIGLGIHLLVKGRPFEQGDTGLFPLLISRRSELIKWHIGKVRLLLGLFQDGLQIQLASFITHSTASSCLVKTRTPKKAIHLRNTDRLPSTCAQSPHA